MHPSPQAWLAGSKQPRGISLTCQLAGWWFWKCVFFGTPCISIKTFWLFPSYLINLKISKLPLLPLVTSAWLHFPFLFFYLPNKLIVIWSVGLLSSCYSPPRLAILRNLLFPSLVFSFLASHLDLVSRIGIGWDVLLTSFLRFSFVPLFSATLFTGWALLEIKRRCSDVLPPLIILGGRRVLSNFFATNISVARLNPEYQKVLKYSNLATQGFNRGFVPI